MNERFEFDSEKILQEVIKRDRVLIGGMADHFSDDMSDIVHGASIEGNLDTNEGFDDDHFGYKLPSRRIRSNDEFPENNWEE